MGASKQPNKIPKIIHYCWFGGSPIPQKTKDYMKTWSDKCPDYKLMEWNETNFDVDKYKYTREAYDNKKWAFVSDVCRFEKVYEYGGIYFDVNTKVLKSFDDLLSLDMFVGFEQDNLIAGCIFGAKRHHYYVKTIIDDYYKKEHLIDEEGTINYRVVNDRMHAELIKIGLEPSNKYQQLDEITVFPKSYFCPRYWDSPKQDAITHHTYSIHYFGSSWNNKEAQRLQRLQRTGLLPDNATRQELEYLRSENAKLIAEVDSFLSIKRSARLVLGNIKRKLKQH